MERFLTGLTLATATLAMTMAVAAPSAYQDTGQQPSAPLGNSAAPDTIQLADYLDFESVSGPTLSPDGKQVLYTRRRVDKMNDEMVSTLRIMDVDGSRDRQLMEGSEALWSPDGTRIAYVRDDDNDQPQIFVRHMDAEGLETQVTSFEFGARSMAWSPDGRQIAFVARVPNAPAWTVELPGKPKGATWTEDPPVLDTLHYRQDRVGLTNNGFDHLFVVPAEGGTPRQLTAGDWNVGARGLGVIAGSPRLSWSPDGATIAFDGAGRPLEAPHWFESHINLVDVETGAIRQLTKGRGHYVNPVFSPDGGTIAYSGYPRHDASYPVPRLYVIDADGSDPRELLGELPDGPTDVTWQRGGEEILFTVNHEGSRNIRAVGLDGTVRDVTGGSQVVGLENISEGGRAVVTVSRADLPVAVATVDTMKTEAPLSVLTDVNADVLHGKALGAVEEVWYDSEAENGETARVQGWIVYPPDFNAEQTYPLLLEIHGGPHAMYDSGFSFTRQEFAARGYVILYTNPRGSTGYGSAFANAIEHRYPGPVDYADLMNGVDHVLEKGFVDRDRMFVTGCSGGGVLTTWIVGHTDRFAAAAALCPVTNWIGMSGTTDVVGWLYNFFPAPFWEDPDPWLEHSPIMHVGKVSTPTLLMTGENDLRTPLGEAEEYYAALKIRGVPTKLVPMKEEYHGTRSKPSNYLRTSLMLRKWFDEYDPTKQTVATADPSERDELNNAARDSGD